MTLNPGDDIHAVVAMSPPNTTFKLVAGVFRQQSVEVKDGDSFTGTLGPNGERLTVISGAKLLTSFSEETVNGVAYWVAHGQTQESPDRSGVCQDGYTRCNRNEGFYINDVALIPVAALEDVTKGRFYFDYTSDRIYFFDSPIGNVVEASDTVAAFYGAHSNVLIKDLIVEKYANRAGEPGAIFPRSLTRSGSNGSFWTIDNVESRLNHGSGLTMGHHFTVINSYFHHNGQLGLSSSGENNLLENSELAYNNTLGFSWGWEAGAFKAVRSANFIARRNYSHDNQGPGMWWDSQNANTIVEFNRTSNNKTAGILYEVNNAGSGTIRYNISINDGFGVSGKTSMWYGGGIAVANSSLVEVHHNTVINGMNGIIALNADRTLSGGGSVPYIRNLSVHHNFIQQETGSAAGIVTNSDNQVWSASNEYSANVYKVFDRTGTVYQWNGARMETEWRGAGHDLSGTWVEWADTDYPSTWFQPGDRLQLWAPAAVMDTPDGTVLGIQPVGSLASITAIAGPILASGQWWWDVDFDTGVHGWITQNMTDPRWLRTRAAHPRRESHGRR